MNNQKFLLVVGGIFLAAFLLRNQERFSGFHHRSTLASTFWISKPQVQHSFEELKLQYPDHHDYFKNACHEGTPNNAELCRYHKHRFDPAQL